ncbi:MAG: phage tail protein [Burkholderiaceae bacterium]|nr:phage tail protein [Burkholderiaceae bacterium]
MPVPTAITDLSTTASANSPAGSDAVFPSLDDYLRAHASFIAQLNAALSAMSGMIVMWSGSVGSIPSGWKLCDGTNGTPDLRDRFVVGAGGGYAVGATGGAASTTLATANLPSHSHSFSATTGAAGSHSHTVPTTSWTSGGGLVAAYRPDSDVAHSTSLNTGGVGDHTHSVSGTTGSAGSGSSFENRPPYYAMCYIMKT